MPETALYEAIVVSEDENATVLRFLKDIKQNISEGRYILISNEEGDYYSRVTRLEGDTVHIRKMWCERREYFRVDDIFPVNYKKADMDISLRKSRIISGPGADPADTDLEDNTISPRLWNMLLSINTKLDLILERLQIESEGLATAVNCRVNLSATGIRFIIGEKVEQGEDLEIGMLLPTTPPTGILAYGNVVRVADTDDGKYEVALHFVDMDDEVREEIIQFALKRQREIIRTQRHQRGNDV